MEPIIELKSLTKDYGNHRGIFNLDLQLNQGELLGFLGPNGAGKTTTLRLVMGYLRPNSGLVEIFGQNNRENSTPIRRKIGYLPGALRLYEDMTGQSMLDYFSHLRGDVDWNYIESLRVRFNADFKRKLKTLSHGNKQKIGIIQAFMHQPDLLILDEPTNGLDPLMQIEFYDLLKETRDRGATIFMSSHNLPEVERVCDRVAIIKDGLLVTIEKIEVLKKKAKRILQVEFEQKVQKSDFEKIPGIADVSLKDNVLTCSITGSMDGFIKTVAKYKVSKFWTQESN